MKPPGKKSLNIDESTHKRIKVASAERGIEMAHLVQQAIDDYLDPSVATGLTPQEQDLTARLVHLLREGNPDVAAMVRNLLASRQTPGAMEKKQKLG